MISQIRERGALTVESLESKSLIDMIIGLKLAPNQNILFTIEFEQFQNTTFSKHITGTNM